MPNRQLTTPVNEYIAELEADPETKRALDEARERIAPKVALIIENHILKRFERVQ